MTCTRWRQWACSLLLLFSYLIGTFSRNFHRQSLTPFLFNWILRLSEHRSSLIHLHWTIPMRPCEQTISIWKAPSFYNFLHLILNFFLFPLNIWIARWIEAARVALVEKIGNHDGWSLGVVLPGRSGHVGSEWAVVGGLGHVLSHVTGRHTWRRVFVVSCVDRRHIFDWWVPHPLPIHNGCLRRDITHWIKLSGCGRRRQWKRRHLRCSYFLNESGVAGISGWGRKRGLSAHKESSLAGITSIVSFSCWELFG